MATFSRKVWRCSTTFFNNFIYLYKSDVLQCHVINTKDCCIKVNSEIEHNALFSKSGSLIFVRRKRQQIQLLTSLKPNKSDVTSSQIQIFLSLNRRSPGNEMSHFFLCKWNVSLDTDIAKYATFRGTNFFFGQFHGTIELLNFL